MCKIQSNLENEMQKFNNFLNKTIVLTSKEYYRKELEKKRRELKLIDTEEFEEKCECCLEYSQKFFEIQSAKNAIDFISLCENIELYEALKSLSAIEQLVIFLLFGEDLSNERIAKNLNLHIYSVSRIKRRALNKLKKILKDGD